MHAREYHRHSIRLKGYDYSQVGAYFVTICTHERRCLFGEVVDGEVRLDEYGEVVQQEWLQSMTTRREIELDAFIVMPNHLHGIVFIRGGEAKENEVVPGNINNALLTNGICVGAHGRAPLRRKPRSLGAFIAGFKSASALRINKIRNTPGIPVWQRNYWEHVIRTEDYLNRIREYVLNNPLRWHVDRENPERVGVDDFECWLQGLASLSRDDRLGTVPERLPS